MQNWDQIPGPIPGVEAQSGLPDEAMAKQLPSEFGHLSDAVFAEKLRSEYGIIWPGRTPAAQPKSRPGLSEHAFMLKLEYDHGIKLNSDGCFQASPSLLMRVSDGARRAASDSASSRDLVPLGR